MAVPGSGTSPLPTALAGVQAPCSTPSSLEGSGGAAQGMCDGWPQGVPWGRWLSGRPQGGGCGVVGSTQCGEQSWEGGHRVALGRGEGRPHEVGAPQWDHSPAALQGVPCDAVPVRHTSGPCGTHLGCLCQPLGWRAERPPDPAHLRSPAPPCPSGTALGPWGGDAMAWHGLGSSGSWGPDVGTAMHQDSWQIPGWHSEMLSEVQPGSGHAARIR